MNVQDRKRTLMDLMLSAEGQIDNGNHNERLRVSSIDGSSSMTTKLMSASQHFRALMMM